MTQATPNWSIIATTIVIIIVGAIVILFIVVILAAIIVSMHIPFLYSGFLMKPRAHYSGARAGSGKHHAVLLGMRLPAEVLVWGFHSVGCRVVTQTRILALPPLVLTGRRHHHHYHDSSFLHSFFYSCISFR